MKTFLLAIVLAAGVNGAWAQDPTIQYTAIQLSDSVYMLKGHGGNVAVSTGSEGLFIVDDQLRTVTGQLLNAIRKISDRPIRFVLNTHYHGDHVGGNEPIGEGGALILSQDNVYARMATAQDSNFSKRHTPPYPRVALPLLTFSDRITLHLNSEPVTAYHVANGHTDGDSIVYFPVSNVIHMGDTFFNGQYPYVDLDAGGSIRGIVAAVDLALSLANEDTRVIPGHGPLAMTEDLRGYHDFLVKAIANVQALVDDGKDLTQVIAAKPTAEWDDRYGKTWITPPQFVAFIYYSLKGIHKYTAPVMPKEEDTAG